MKDQKSAQNGPERQNQPVVNRRPDVVNGQDENGSAGLYPKPMDDYGKGDL